MLPIIKGDHSKTMIIRLKLKSIEDQFQAQATYNDPIILALRLPYNN